MSFTNDKQKTENTLQPTDQESDSTKGFRSLLNNTAADNGGIITFEINPSIIPYKDAYLHKQGDNFAKMKLWAQPYFLIYEKVLSAYALPLELKYLSVVESSLQPFAVSSAGAVGPWQLMPSEAKRFGLKVSHAYDERTNFYKSTEAAAKLLKELYSQYNDWLLVIAAYNCGKACLNRDRCKAKLSTGCE